MDERIKEKLINRAKTNPYVNFLGIDFTVIEEGRVEAHMPLHDEQRQYSGVTHGVSWQLWRIRSPVSPPIR